MSDRTETKRQHLEDAIRQAGELAAWLAAIHEARPCPLVRLAAEMAARLDDAVEAVALA